MTALTDFEAKFTYWDATAESGMRIGPRPVVSTPADRGVYFVSPTGTGVGTEADPASFPPAAGDISAGDVVFLRGGTYILDQDLDEQWIVKGGTVGLPITYESFPGEIASIEVDPLKIPPTYDSGRTQSQLILTGDYTILRRMVIKGCTRGIAIEGIYNELHGIYVHGCFATGFLIRSPNELSPPWTGNYAAYNLIQDCISEANSDVIYVANGNNADGYQWPFGTNNTARYCEGKGNSDDNFDIWSSSNGVVEYCIAHEAGLGAGNGVGFKMGGGTPSENNRFENCLSFNNVTRGFDDNGGKSITFRSCASLGNGTWGVSTSDEVTTSYCVATDTVVSDGATEIDNSWNRAAGMAYIQDTDPTTVGFMQPVPGYDDIGAFVRAIITSNLLPDSFTTA